MAPRDQGRWGVVRPGLAPTPYTKHAIPFPFKHISFPIVTYLLFLLRPMLLNTHDPASCTLVRLHCCIIGFCLLYLVTLVVFIEYYRTNQVFFIFVIADIKPRDQVPGACLYIAGTLGARSFQRTFVEAEWKFTTSQQKHTPPATHLHHSPPSHLIFCTPIFLPLHPIHHKIQLG
jgi:hypothetical protein